MIKKMLDKLEIFKIWLDIINMKNHLFYKEFYKNKLVVNL